MRQVFCMAVIGTLVAFAAPAAQATDKSGYLTDKSGNIVTTKSSLCIRTKSWSDKNADPGCMAKAKASSK